MKTFHNARGHAAGSTMTVAELRAKLAEFPDYMPVFGTWEGVTGYITPHSFCVQAEHKGRTADECDCLVIDVEKY